MNSERMFAWAALVLVAGELTMATILAEGAPSKRAPAVVKFAEHNRVQPSPARINIGGGLHADPNVHPQRLPMDLKSTHHRSERGMKAEN